MLANVVMAPPLSTPTVRTLIPVPIVEHTHQPVDGAERVTLGASQEQGATSTDGADCRADDALRQAFHDGDVDALGRVFDLYSRPVWGVAMGVLRDRQLADEATQEAFMRAWRAADRFDPNRSLAPWLMTIARRTALDVLRRENRPTRGDHEPEQDAVVHLPGIERAWETWEVKAALEQIPEEERQVVWFAHFHGMSHPQIADQLGVPVGTVKSRSFRAHKRLASLLQHVVAEGATS